MNTLDIIIICILGYCLIRGIFRGLIKELSSIIGVLAGFYAAYTYYLPVSGMLIQWMTNPAYRNILAFMIIFCGILLIVGILGVIIKYILKIASAGWIDRLLGTVFAVVKGVLISSVLLVILTAFLPKGASIVKKSVLAPHVIQISEKMARMAPDGLKKQFYTKFEDLKNIWKKN